MKYSFSTFSQLERDPSVGSGLAYSICSYAETHKTKLGKWGLSMVVRDKGNPNLFRASFKLSNEPDSCLEYYYELIPKEFPGYRCTLIKKVCKSEDCTN